MLQHFKLKLCLSFLFIPCFAFSYVKANLHLLKFPKNENFKVSVYARVHGARSMTIDNNGTVYVGSRSAGKVYALPNKDKRFEKADSVEIIARGLDQPNGVTFYKGHLYVVTVHKVLRYDNLLPSKSKAQIHLHSVTIYDGLPAKGSHDWRYAKVGPDGLLYIGIGAPCNLCLSKNPLYASIIRMPLNGKSLEVYASGVRNTVGFAWEPNTKQLWFTDNGIDWMGDNLPPDKLNFAPRPGMNFGYPYFYGNNLRTKKFKDKKLNPKDYTPPALELPAHVAALGMSFYTGKMFPKKYHNQIFIAEHGSWNRSKKIGYRVIAVKLKNNKPVSKTIFLEGWLQGRREWGRPVDTLVLPDGSLLISDDYSGTVYRVSYAHKSKHHKS